MNADHKLACAGFRDHSLEKWISASWDLGLISHQSRTMAAAMQVIHKEEMATLINALQQVTIGGKQTCFACGRGDHFKRDCLPALPSLVCHTPYAAGAERDSIRPGIAGPSSISRGSL